MAISKTGALLVDSASTYPVLRTTDGGATWHIIAIPRQPARGNFTMLPDGSLLLADRVGYRGPWKLLARGRQAWCALREPARTGQHPFMAAPPAVINGRLWWLTGSDSSSASPTVNQIAVSALAC